MNSERMMSEHSAITSPRGSSLLPLVLFLAFTLDTLLYSIVIPFLPARAIALGASQLEVGMLFASYAAGLLLATPVAGQLTDYFGGKVMVVVGLVLLVSATLVFASASSLPLLFLARTSQGVAAAIPWTAGLAVIAKQYSGAARYQRFTQVFAATGVGILIGPSLGGVLYTWRGLQAPFYFVAALAGVDSLITLAVFLAMSRKSVTGVQQSLPRVRSESLGSLGSLGSVGVPARAVRWMARPRVVEALVATSAGALLLALVEPTLPVLLAKRFGLIPLTIGLVFGGVVILYMLVQGVVAALLKKYSAGAALFFGLTIGPLTLILLGVGTTLFHIIFALSMLALSFAFLLTPALELLTYTAQQAIAQGKERGVASGLKAVSSPTEHVDAEEDAFPYGRLYAAYNVAYAVGVLLGPSLAGEAVTLFGWTLGLSVTGAALFVLYLPLSLHLFFTSTWTSSKTVAVPGRTAMLGSRYVTPAGERPRKIEVIDILEAIELVTIVATEEIVEIEEIDGIHPIHLGK